MLFYLIVNQLIIEVFGKQILCRNVYNLIVLISNRNRLVIKGFFFQHLPFGSL